MANANTAPVAVDDEALNRQLDYLRLGFVREHYAELAAQAASEHRDHVGYLGQLVEGEAQCRQARSIERRIRLARFPVRKTLDQFDWSWPRKLNRAQVQNLFRLNFIEERANVVLIGGVGLGKSHLAIALGMAACQRGHSVLFAGAIDVINTLVAAQNDKTTRIGPRRPLWELSA